MVEIVSVRIDKWLWAVRIFKTRSLASAACRQGRVRICGLAVKPSRNVRPDDVVVVDQNHLARTLKVLRLLDRRVGARVVPEYLQDQTPPSEYEKARQFNVRPRLLAPKGAGRPTKKNRRAIDRLYQSHLPSD